MGGGAPAPWAQLFEAAGLLRLRLAALTAAFFVGRTASYLIYLGTAKIVHRTDAAQALTSR